MDWCERPEAGAREVGSRGGVGGWRAGGSGKGEEGMRRDITALSIRAEGDEEGGHERCAAMSAMGSSSEGFRSESGSILRSG
eukprot:scaffold192370_cov31-Tisochrysis_lutea.AAC.4